MAQLTIRHAEQLDETPISSWEARRAISAGIEDQIAALRKLNAHKRVVEIAIFVSIWLCGALTVIAGLRIGATAPAVALRVIGTFIAAVGLNAFVLLLHEGMHHTLFKRAWLNRWVSVALGTCLLISFSAYQVMHIRHHRYLGDPRDPDDYRNYTRNPRLLWLMHYLRLLVGAFIYILMIPVLASRLGSAYDRRRIVEEYLFMALVYAGLALFVPGWLLVNCWLLPIVLVAYMTNIRGFTQHGLADADDPFLASRSIEANPIVAFCLLNENLHLEHHLFPEIPSYNLPQLHNLIWPRLPHVVTGSSYLGFMAHFLRATLTMDETPIGLKQLAGGEAEG